MQKLNNVDRTHLALLDSATKNGKTYLKMKNVLSGIPRIPRLAIFRAKKFSPAGLISQVQERFHFGARETSRRLGRAGGLEATEVSLSLICPLSKKPFMLFCSFSHSG